MRRHGERGPLSVIVDHFQAIKKKVFYGQLKQYQGGTGLRQVNHDPISSYKPLS
jgi:hypothetical protein